MFHGWDLRGDPTPDSLVPRDDQIEAQIRKIRRDRRPKSPRAPRKRTGAR